MCAKSSALRMPSTCHRASSNRCRFVPGIWEGSSGVFPNTPPMSALPHSGSSIGARYSNHGWIDGSRVCKVPGCSPKAMSNGEIKRLLMITPDLRYRTAMTLTYACGLRISETVAVATDEVKPKEGLLHAHSGKGATERMAPLSGSIVGHLNDYWKKAYPKPVSSHDCSRAGLPNTTSSRTPCTRPSIVPAVWLAFQPLHILRSAPQRGHSPTQP